MITIAGRCVRTKGLNKEVEECVENINYSERLCDGVNEEEKGNKTYHCKIILSLARGTSSLSFFHRWISSCHGDFVT